MQLQGVSVLAALQCASEMLWKSLVSIICEQWGIPSEKILLSDNDILLLTKYSPKGFLVPLGHTN